MAKKKTAKKRSTKKEALSFEESLEALKVVLSDLEEGHLPLAESLEKYEAGIRHLRECDATLKMARAKIERLVKVDAEGQPVTKPFEHSATVDAAVEVDEDELQSELDEEQNEEDADWDGGLF